MLLSKKRIDVNRRTPMFRSIKNRIIFVVICLIFLIQIASTTYQYFQVRSIFFSEFVLGAQNLSQAAFIELSAKTISGLSGYTSEIAAKDLISREKEVDDFINLYITTFQQTGQYGNILNARNDLLEMKFVNKKGNVVADSYKLKGEVVHENMNTKKKLTIFDNVKVLIQKEQTGSVENDGKIHIFVPFKLKGVFLGGIVMIYSTKHIDDAHNNILLVSFGFLALFTIISVIVIVLFITNVLTRPVNRMIKLMKQLADGNFDDRFEIRIKDEIGEMGGEVNNLVGSLQSVLNDISEVMGAVEKGDLSKRITADLKGDLDQIKDRINKSIALLSATIGTVLQSSGSVQTSAKELSNSANILSSSAAEQAASLEEISSSITAIENHSQQNSKNSQEAKQISKATLELVECGTKEMEKMTLSMNQINSTSLDITKIIKIIDEIAFQTNLLALNAAVEAARAGKFGKGFAVVAEEVRNLAARSAEAAKDTSNLIELSTKEVEIGVENASKTSTILEKIVNKVKKSNTLVSRIAQASHEQSSAISEINVGITQVNETVQQNCTVSEETAAASEMLLNQSNTQQQHLNRFVLLESEQKSTTEIDFDENNRRPLVEHSYNIGLS